MFQRRHPALRNPRNLAIAMFVVILIPVFSWLGFQLYFNDDTDSIDSKGSDVSASVVASSATTLSPEDLETTVKTIDDKVDPVGNIEETTTTQTSSSVSVASTTGETEPVDSDVDSFVLELNFDSRIDGVSDAQFREAALSILNDSRGWSQAGFVFEYNPDSKYNVIVAEGLEVDQLCLPLNTVGKLSCQQGNNVAINGDRWRDAVSHWDGSLQDYRDYVVNHELGHLINQRHPASRCTNGVSKLMEQQTKSLPNCSGNGWPLVSEIELAKKRPVVIG